MFTYIYEFLTKKQVNNSTTLMPPKPPIRDQFMEYKNISANAVALYSRIPVGEQPDYFKFIDSIHNEMNKWISKKYIDDTIHIDVYMLNRLNADFIAEYCKRIRTPHAKFIDNKYILNADLENVFNDKYQINESLDDGTIQYNKKSAKDFTLQDFKQIDFWKSRNIYADFDFEKYKSFRDGYGYVNSYRTIPRHFDRDPSTFGLVHRDSNRASLTDTPRAFDNDEYYRAKGL